MASHWALLLDPQNTLTPEHVMKPDMATRFIAQTGAPALGYTHDTAWLRLSVTRPDFAAQDWWLELRSALLNDITLFIPKEDGAYDLRTSGDRHPFAGRDVAYRNPIFKLNLPPDRPITLFLRIRSTSTMTFPLVLWTPDAFVAAVGTELPLFGLFYAAHLLVMMTCLWFYRITRDPSELLIGCVVLVNLLSSLAYEGFAYQYFFNHHPHLNEALLVLSGLAITPVGIVFISYYLGFTHSPWRPWALGLSIFTGGLALLSAPLILLDIAQWMRPLNMLWCLVLTGFLLPTTAVMARRGHQPARVLLLALGILFFGVLLRLGRNIGLLDPGNFVDNAHYLGILAYLIVMNQGINLRYTEMRGEKNFAQALALDASRKATLELEIMVQERTLALQQSMVNINETLAVERSARDEQQQLLATVSHELRTPLAVIDATAQNLELDDVHGDPVTLARYKKILRATARLTSLVDDSLNEERFELLRQGVRIQQTNLAALLEDAANAASVLSESHRFKLEVADLPATFPCDQSLMGLVLRSLADNAVKYSPPGSEVLLRGHATPDGVVVEVIDNGPGVSPTELPYLFDRFYRGQNAENQPGTGLGLALARRMITMQGGTLSLESKPGQGFRVTIFLPHVA